MPVASRRFVRDQGVENPSPSRKDKRRGPVQRSRLQPNAEEGIRNTTGLVASRRRELTGVSPIRPDRPTATHRLSRGGVLKEPLITRRMKAEWTV